MIQVPRKKFPVLSLHVEGKRLVIKETLDFVNAISFKLLGLAVNNSVLFMTDDFFNEYLIDTKQAKAPLPKGIVKILKPEVGEWFTFPVHGAVMWKISNDRDKFLLSRQKATLDENTIDNITRNKRIPFDTFTDAYSYALNYQSALTTRAVLVSRAYNDFGMLPESIVKKEAQRIAKKEMISLKKSLAITASVLKLQDYDFENTRKYALKLVSKIKEHIASTGKPYYLYPEDLYQETENDNIDADELIKFIINKHEIKKQESH